MTHAEALRIAFDLARSHNLPLKALLEKNRAEHIFRVRKKLYARLRDEGWSYPQIGAFCGGRAHTAVLRALR
jgi:chromosomal replication initiation ATPase DnaA